MHEWRESAFEWVLYTAGQASRSGPRRRNPLKDFLDRLVEHRVEPRLMLTLVAEHAIGCTCFPSLRRTAVTTRGAMAPVLVFAFSISGAS